MSLADPDRDTVAILLSTYNGEKYVRALLESLVAQSYDNWRLYVRDDGSTDATVGIINEFAARDSRIQLRAETNIGVVRSFFSLLSRADRNCGFYAFCDQDDVWEACKIEQAVELLSGIDASTPALYCARQQYVDEDLTPLGYSRMPRRTDFYNAVVENVVTGCAAVMNQAAQRRVSPHLPENVIMHDWWFYLVVSCFGQIVYDSKATVLYRQHGNNVLGATSNPFERFWRRAVNHLGNSASIRLSEQVAAFLAEYGESIDREKKTELSRFVAAKHSLTQRLKYAMTMKLRRNSAIDTALLRVLIVLGRY